MDPTYVVVFNDHDMMHEIKNAMVNLLLGPAPNILTVPRKPTFLKAASRKTANLDPVQVAVLSAAHYAELCRNFKMYNMMVTIYGEERMASVPFKKKPQSASVSDQ